MAALTKYDIAKLPAENIRNDSFLERTVLSWVYRVVSRGRKLQLTRAELCMPAAQATETVSLRFQREWAKELEARKAGGTPSLVAALRRAFGWEFAISGCFKLLWSFFVIMGAYYFVRSLVSYVNDPALKPNEFNTVDIPNKARGAALRN